MPTNKKKKGKNKVKNRSEAAVTCAGCSRKVIRKDAIECVCTRVLFCNENCREVSLTSNRHDCQGPPEQHHDIRNTISNMRRNSTTAGREDAVGGPLWTEEFRRTISGPEKAILLSDAIRTGYTFDELTVDHYVRYADQGHACYAYSAGSCYKNRLLGQFNVDTGVVDNGGREELSVLMTDELAFKYMLQAAKGGIGFGMQSVADCYENGQGTRKSMLKCREWLWEASLVSSTGALYALDTKSIIPLELNSFSNMFQSMLQSYPNFPGYTNSGPNLGSLLVTLLKDLERGNFKVPAFAAVKPTLSVGSTPRQGSTGPVTVVGSAELRQVCSVVGTIERLGKDVYFLYGRRGTAKEATAQTYGAASRSLDCDSFIVPPVPVCDEHYSQKETSELMKIIARACHGGVHCVHDQNKKPLIACEKCIVGALGRLAVVGTGSAVLSLDEHLAARGCTAIWRAADGTPKSETFKYYARGEVESVLAALVAYNCDLAHPLFVAQDPNFFWPLVQSHGCVRAALEYVAPHVDWTKKLGPVKSPPMPIPVLQDEEGFPVEPGTLLRKCGNYLCLNVALARSSSSFQTCVGCERRYYCSKECCVTDWVTHKAECGGRGPGHQRDPSSQNHHALPPPSMGEEVIVHGLNAKPEFNGLVGVVGGELRDGRYPVKLHISQQKRPIAVKPSNLHQLNVYCHERKNKAQLFECFIHGAETCQECSLDFHVVNHLLRLQFKNGELILPEMIEQAADTAFATIPGYQEDQEGKLDPNIPIECQGIRDKDKRFVLKALLEDKEEKSMLGTAAVVGLSCFSARNVFASRPSTVPHLVKLLHKT